MQWCHFVALFSFSLLSELAITNSKVTSPYMLRWLNWIFQSTYWLWVFLCLPLRTACFWQELPRMRCGPSRPTDALLSSAHFLCTRCSAHWHCNNLHQEADLIRISFFWVNLWPDQFPNIGNCRAAGMLVSILGSQQGWIASGSFFNCRTSLCKMQVPA